MTDQRDWRTSSYSTDQGNCVEVARTEHAVYVRDTKNRDGGVLRMSIAEWDALVKVVNQDR